MGDIELVCEVLAKHPRPWKVRVNPSGLIEVVDAEHQILAGVTGQSAAGLAALICLVRDTPPADTPADVLLSQVRHLLATEEARTMYLRGKVSDALRGSRVRPWTDGEIRSFVDDTIGGGRRG